ncbi:MAG: imidazole glycerol phosphate synthase subunit HisH [Helicobacteraceae bacterium]|nr:imidazole glycerol phosphate synthase subunit HisH [Helicobacteraceae bacterium]
MIAIVDYKMGNLQSVKNAFKVLDQEIVVESDPDKLKNYDKIILPGVGAFGDAMDHLRERGTDEALKEYATSGKTMMGICLGMQLLFESSKEFGEHKGLGLVKGSVVPFNTEEFNTSLKVPHMGWNRMTTQKHKLFENLDENHYLYFVHSFHVKCQNNSNIIGECEYGYNFTSAIANDNILGIQPHPEKSHKNGLQILQNFINL